MSPQDSLEIHVSVSINRVQYNTAMAIVVQLIAMYYKGNLYALGRMLEEASTMI